MAKKQKPLCKNCGDETTFPASAVGDRVHKGWCVSCFTTWKKFGPKRPDQAWREPLGLHARRPFDSRNADAS